MKKLIVILIIFISCTAKSKTESEEDRYWRLKKQMGEYRWELDSLLKVKYPKNGNILEDDSLSNKITRLSIMVDRINDTLQMLKHVNQK